MRMRLPGLEDIFTALDGLIVGVEWAGVSDQEYELIAARCDLAAIATELGLPTEAVEDGWVKRLIFQRHVFADRRVD